METSAPMWMPLLLFLVISSRATGLFIADRFGSRSKDSSHHRRPLRYHRKNEVRMSAAENILAIVRQKKEEIQRMVEDHSDAGDPLRMRMNYANSSGRYALRTALRRHKDPESYHQLSVIADLKRRTPTAVPHRLVEFDDAGQVCQQFCDYGCDAVMVCTDSNSYGGSMADLASSIRAVGKKIPVIMKDIVVHPIQLALSTEMGATGALLIACVLGSSLEDLMDSATMMGTEVIVEVHTPNECYKALEYGANVILVNQWDRITGKLHKNQAFGLRGLMPNEVLSIAAGGIQSVADAAKLADEGYDAVVLGHALGKSHNPGKLVSDIRNRVGLPRTLLGMGLSA